MAVLEPKSQITTSLYKAISYIQNVHKTTDAETGKRLIAKNWPGRLDANEEARDMIADVLRSPKRGGRTVYVHHYVQSFSDDDARKLTNDQVLELGRRMAEHMTDGSSLYIVATHLTQAKLHNHIFICNYDHVTRRRHQFNARTLQAWRNYNDEICRAMGLSVLPAAKRGHQIPRTDHTRVSLGQLYAEADGASWLDRLRDRIDLAGTRSDSFQQFRDLLHQQGISVTARGRHLTYMLTGSGLKVRDTRLGEAYTMGNVFGRITKRPVTEITFTTRLVTKRTENTVRIMIPGTHGRKRITLRRSLIVKTGPRTWRAYLPQDRPLTLADRRGRLAGRLRVSQITRYFVQPDSSLEESYKTVRPRLTAQQLAQRNRRYIWQARKIDDFQLQLDALQIVENETHGGHDTAQALVSLSRRLDRTRAAMAALIAEIADQDNGRPALHGLADAGELNDQDQRIRRLEEDIDSIKQQIATVRTVDPDAQKEALDLAQPAPEDGTRGPEGLSSILRDRDDLDRFVREYQRETIGYTDRQPPDTDTLADLLGGYPIDISRFDEAEFADALDEAQTRQEAREHPDEAPRL